MKKCPYCAEEIQDEAIVCRYCGRELPGEEGDVSTHPPVYKLPRRALIWISLGIVILLWLFYGLYRLFELGQVVVAIQSGAIRNPLVFRAALNDAIGAVTLGWICVSGPLSFLLIFGLLTGLAHLFKLTQRHLYTIMIVLSVLVVLIVAGAAIYSILSVPIASKPISVQPNIATPQPTEIRESPSVLLPECRCPWGSYREISSLSVGKRICASGRVYILSDIGYLYWTEEYGSDEWRKEHIRMSLPFWEYAFHPGTITDVTGQIEIDDEGEKIISIRPSRNDRVIECLPPR